MIRAYEREVSWKAGGLAIAVHLALLGAMLISFNWKVAHPALNVTEVELWDSIPSVQVSKPEPVIKEQPKPEPVVKEEPKAEPKVEPEVDIALEKKLKELEQKKIDDQVKKDKALEQKKQLIALQAEARKEEMRDSDKLAKERSAKEALKKLQQESLADEKVAGAQQAMGAKAAANAGVIDEFIGKIQAKIREKVNKTPCSDGNPELIFEIRLMPKGLLNGNPTLVKSNGNAACNEAVERAIIASDPLPIPDDALLFPQFRNLRLTFRPNDGN